MQVLSISKYAQIFATTVGILKKELASKKFLLWDKDDKPAMDFVAACANIRAYIFSIPQKSKFAIKCKKGCFQFRFLFRISAIAGNIIPAIATANAMIAGAVVLYAFRVLQEDYQHCPTIYLRQKSLYSKVVLATDNGLQKPNPKCYVCSPVHVVDLFINLNKWLVSEFETEILKNALSMVAPDVMIDGTGTMVISSEAGETEVNNSKTLHEAKIVDGSILKVDDFLQNYELTINVNDYEPKNKDDPPYILTGNPEDFKPKEEEGECINMIQFWYQNSVSAVKNGVGPKKDTNEQEQDDDDDLVICTTDDDSGASSSKRRKINPPEEDDDLIMLDDELLD